MGSDAISELVWTEHEAWLHRREARQRELGRWSVSDWRLCWLIAESKWEQEPFDLYVNAVARASWDVALRHAARRFR